jgi:hypothetical protein
METINFALLPDLVLIELFSYFTSVELLHSFWALNTRVDSILFESNVIRHVDWSTLSDHHRDVTRNRLFTVASLTTDCLSIATPLLQRKTLRRLSLVNVSPGKLMDYIWTDWRHGLDGLQEIIFITTNSVEPSVSNLDRTGIMLAYLIGYVPNLHSVHFPPRYSVDNFGVPPSALYNIVSPCSNSKPSKKLCFACQSFYSGEH